MHLLCLFLLIVLMCHMTYFNTPSHFMAMSEDTEINFLGLENFYMLYIAFTLPLHADRFDVPHGLLQHCFTLHGHVRGHQDQLLEPGVLRQGDNLFKATQASTLCLWKATHTLDALNLPKHLFTVSHSLKKLEAYESKIHQEQEQQQDQQQQSHSWSRSSSG